MYVAHDIILKFMPYLEAMHALKLYLEKSSVSTVVRWNVTEGRMKVISKCNQWEWVHVYIQAKGVYGIAQR